VHRWHRELDFTQDGLPCHFGAQFSAIGQDSIMLGPEQVIRRMVQFRRTVHP